MSQINSTELFLLSWRGNLSCSVSSTIAMLNETNFIHRGQLSVGDFSVWSVLVLTSLLMHMWESIQTLTGPDNMMLTSPHPLFFRRFVNFFMHSLHVQFKSLFRKALSKWKHVLFTILKFGCKDLAQMSIHVQNLFFVIHPVFRIMN